MQENTDPSADLLYAQNFALMSLHEASHAVGLDTPTGKRYSQAVDRLAEFFVRVQAQSTEQRNIDGAWMRAVGEWWPKILVPVPSAQSPETICDWSAVCRRGQMGVLGCCK